jgi:hypothetical protein
MFLAVNPLEMQARMGWVAAPQLVAPARLLLDGVGKLGKASQEIGRELRFHS